MDECREITAEMLPNRLKVDTGGQRIDFMTAKGLAREKAKEKAEDPVLLAWFDRSAGAFSPDVICCGDDKPTWLIYAESRGGDISVDVNDLEYVFVFTEGV